MKLNHRHVCCKIDQEYSHIKLHGTFSCSFAAQCFQKAWTSIDLVSHECCRHASTMLTWRLRSRHKGKEYDMEVIKQLKHTTWNRIKGLCVDMWKYICNKMPVFECKCVLVALCPYLCMNVLLLSGIQAFVLGLKVGQWEVHRQVPVYSNPAYC